MLVVRQLRTVAGFQQYIRAFSEQNFGLGLVESHLIVVPAAPLEEQPTHISAVVWLEVRRVFDKLEIVGDFIDGDRVPPREILKDAGEETLRKEEAGNPEDDGSSDIDPLLEKGEPGLQISDIGAQRFEGGVALAHPQVGDLAVEQSPGGSLERGVHDYLAHHGQPQVFQRRTHDLDQPVEPLQLLR